MADMLARPEQGIGRQGLQVPWQFRDLGLALACMAAAGIFALVLLAIFFAAVEDASDDTKMAAALAATLIVEVALLVSAFWFGARRYGGGWRALGFRPASRWTWWLVPAVVLAAYSALGIYFLIVELIGLGELVPESTLPEDVFDNPVILPLVGILAVLAAPIAEETFFRGFLFAGLRARWGPLWAALASSFLFALLHFNVGSIIPFTVIGMLLAWAYAFSGSLWTAVWAHLIFNSVSFAISVASGGGA